MIGFTSRQLATLRFVAGFIEAKERSPSLGEVQEGLGLRHKSRALYALQRLAQRGEITRTGRTIKLQRTVTIPRAPDSAPLYFVQVQP